MAEQTEKAFLKQPGVFLSSKKTGKGKRPGKGGNRYFKSIGLGFKTLVKLLKRIYVVNAHRFGIKDRLSDRHTYGSILKQ